MDIKVDALSCRSKGLEVHGTSSIPTRKLANLSFPDSGFRRHGMSSRSSRKHTASHRMGSIFLESWVWVFAPMNAILASSSWSHFSASLLRRSASSIFSCFFLSAILSLSAAFFEDRNFRAQNISFEPLSSITQKEEMNPPNASKNTHECVCACDITLRNLFCREHVRLCLCRLPPLPLHCLLVLGCRLSDRRCTRVFDRLCLGSSHLGVPPLGILIKYLDQRAVSPVLRERSSCMCLRVESVRWSVRVFADGLPAASWVGCFVGHLAHLSLGRFSNLGRPQRGV